MRLTVGEMAEIRAAAASAGMGDYPGVFARATVLAVIRGDA